MDSFQLTSTSIAIVLEVFSEDVVPENGRADSQFEGVQRMQKRVACGELWQRFGGLDAMESELNRGFIHHGLNSARDGITGERIQRKFPDVVTELFRVLREHANLCGESKASNLAELARAALPVLRGFVSLKYVTASIPAISP
jgi:hypothetical protein